MADGQSVLLSAVLKVKGNVMFAVQMTMAIQETILNVNISQDLFQLKNAHPSHVASGKLDNGESVL